MLLSWIMLGQVIRIVVALHCLCILFRSTFRLTSSQRCITLVVGGKHQIDEVLVVFSITYSSENTLCAFAYYLQWQLLS